MPRTLDRAAHARRRGAFIGAAERLIRSKGYEQMSVQDVLDALDASRGAFYHYFDSKVGLLAAVVERMVEESIGALRPILADRGLSATDKLGALFAGVARHRGARTELVLELARVWSSDANVLVRDRLRRATVAHLTPVLAAILRQGCAEGAFTASAPDETARVLASLWLGLSETASELYVARQAGAVTFEAAERALAAHYEAFERILGIPAGSLPFDRQLIREWFG